MEYKKKNLLSLMLVMVVAVFALASCYETNYYHRYHHHTRGWYDRHHQAYPPGVDFKVDVR
jgi:hypothetical protein